MTISTSSSSIQVAGNSIQQTFQIPFIIDSASLITVTSIASNGTQALLSPSTYTVAINPANPNQLWGVGGSVTLGTAPALGTSLLIQRTLPLTQNTSVQNQGNYYAQVTELALDTLEMQIQQVAARTGSFRGIWNTGISYTYGDVVQDGANGANSQSLYMCAIANISGVWATDLAAGDWVLVAQSALPSVSLPLAVLNGGTGVTTSTGTGSTVLSNSPTFTGTASFQTLTSSSAITAASFSPTSGTVPNVGAYLAGTNKYGISTNGALGLAVGYYNGSGAPVNYVQTFNAGAGFFPYVESDGSDANSSLVFVAKGTGSLIFNTNGPRTSFLDVTQLIVSHTALAVNYLNITGGASGSGPTISTTANNAPINITPNGTGSVVVPNLTVTSTNIPVLGMYKIGSSELGISLESALAGAFRVIGGPPVNHIEIWSSGSGGQAVAFNANNSGGDSIVGFSYYGKGGSSNIFAHTFFADGSTQLINFNGNGNIEIGTAAIASNATSGFLWITSCPGAPTGSPTAPYTNAAALVVDTADSKLYVRVGSSWKSVALT